MRPSLARYLHQVADPEHALGVEAVDRLVEDERARVAEQGRRDAEPLAHAEREAADAALGDRRQSPVISMTSSTRLSGMPCVAAMARRWLRALRPVCTALASSSAPTSVSGEWNEA